ncbi:MAG: cation:proton antiporter [Candidatus Eisenbacteria bacterium]
MHEFPLLLNIGVALTAALIGGVCARAARLPTLVGYLLAGVAIGPFTPGFVGDAAAIGELAEMGVVFLMFGVGLHFSMKDVWRVRDPAIVGALLQMALTSLAGYGLAIAWGWSRGASLVLGLSISVASTVVLIRALLDRGKLHTHDGQIAVGWLVLEDLATVAILLALPTLANSGGGLDLGRLGTTLVKAAAFIVLMLVVGARAVPWLLLRIAHTRSKELFLLLALTVALGTALGAAKVFGVSLALGAFLAGVVVAESPLSHQIGADVLPFREAFAVLFFVSVGMLVDPRFLWSNAGPVLLLTALVVVGKAAIAFLLCVVLRQPVHTGLLVGAGLGQIGEFSFILGQAAVSLGLFAAQHYSMLLAAALLSITLNPLLFHAVTPLERRAMRRALSRGLRDADAATQPPQPHVVIVGCGRVGGQLLDALRRAGEPMLVIDSDPARVEELRREGVPVLFGDAANSEILRHAGLERAKAVVVGTADEATTALAVAAAKDLAPQAFLLARAATPAGMQLLSRLGAHEVILPEMEGGLEIVRHTLVHLGFPREQVTSWAERVRHARYDARQSPTTWR